MSVLVVGSVALDTVEAPAGRADEALGGAATYASLAAAKFGAPVGIVAVVGDDFPAAHVATLRGAGVDDTGLEVVAGRTFRWTGRYHEDVNHRDTLDTQLNVFADFAPKIPASLRQAQYVFLANIDPRLQLGVLDQVEAPRLVLWDTMNFWITGSRAEVDAVLARVDVAFLNDQEARLLTGLRNLHEAGSAVREMGPRWVVIKKGEHGAALYTDEGIFQCPAFPVRRVVDPTGAGDSFAGGVVGYLAATGGAGDACLRRALTYGTATASYCVEGFSVGALLAARRDALDARYAALRAMTAIPPAE
jgi:sugar/nucleoside kinase (ribokinase family)